MEATPKKTTKSSGYWVIAVAVSIVLVGGGIVALRTWYNHNLRPVSSSTTTSFFTISPGTGVQQIALNLHVAGLIRSVQAFETYVTSNDFHTKLQAGTYRLSPSMSVQTIVTKMVNGDVARDLLTILPGKRLDQIKQAFTKAGYSKSEVDSAFNPAKYTDHPALATLPRGASLEGYLYPDSFQKQTDTPAKTIVRESLDEMAKHLTNDILNGFAVQGLSAYKGVVLASIVGQESGTPNDQPIVAQLFLSRLKQQIALQSNVTAYYAADIAGVARNVNIESPYNTYLHKGLPPGPISNVTDSALRAVAHPAKTKYLYFITGDNGQMYFSYTQQEHDAAVEKYCQQGCAH